MAARHQDSVSLSPELWGKVFAFLDEDHTPFESWKESVSSSEGLQQRLMLRTVCKSFNAVHATHLQRLAIPENISDMGIPGLLAWVRRSNPSLTSLQLGCAETSVVTAVLATLACANTPLTMLEADLSDIPRAFPLQLISAFRLLTGCSLMTRCRQDLTPLQQLPHLTDLLLQGAFCHLDKLAHLTQLRLYDCIDMKCTTDCEFVSVLEELSLVLTNLQGLHEQGLSACCGLKRLTVDESILSDRQQNHQFAEDVIPANISFITGLDMLELKFVTAEHPPLNWISQLVSLQDLDVTCACFQYAFIKHLTTLKILTSLSLNTEHYSSEVVDSCISLDVCWQVWQSLKIVSILGVQASFGQHSLSLLQLDCLTHVSFELMPISSRDMAYFADILYQFSSSRPNVCLCVSNEQLGARVWSRQDAKHYQMLL